MLMLLTFSSPGYCNKLYANLTFDKAGSIGLGADFEFDSTSTVGFGGYSRILFEEHDNDEGNQDGIIALGGFMRAHFVQENIDFFVSPGFGLTQIDFGANEETVMGPAFITGFNVKVSNFFVGFNVTQLYGWFGDVHGLFEQPFMLSFVLPM